MISYMYKGYLIVTVIFYTLFTLSLGLYGVIDAFHEIAAYGDWDPNTIFLTFTYWNFVLQYIFYIVELLHVYEVIMVTQETKENILNIIFAPGVSILGYWILINSLQWGLLIPWYVDISIHGINILMLMGLVVLKYPCIGQLDMLRNILFPFIVPIIYFIVTVTYTTITRKMIYPSNLFSFVSIENNPPYGWIGVLFLCVAIPLPQIIFYFVCNSLRKTRYRRVLN